MEKLVGKTPKGGDYSLIEYFNDKGETTTKDEATNVRITEWTNGGKLVGSTSGRLDDGD